MISLLATVFFSLAQPPSVPPEKASFVQSFLLTFAANPSESRKFVTKDAVMAIGDIGGPFVRYVNAIKREPNWLLGCRVGRIEPMEISPEELRNPDIDPALKRGTISAFRGAYSCARPDGSMREVGFTTILRDDRILQFFLGGER